MRASQSKRNPVAGESLNVASDDSKKDAEPIRGLLWI
jgi:hypothetical protein